MGLQACRYALRVAGSNGAQRSLVGRHLAAVAIALVLLVLGQRALVAQQMVPAQTGWSQSNPYNGQVAPAQQPAYGQPQSYAQQRYAQPYGSAYPQQGSRLTRNSHIRHSRSRIRSNIRSRVMVRPNRARSR